MIYQAVNIMFKPSTWSLDLCDCSNAYIVVKRKINVTGTDNADWRN